MKNRKWQDRLVKKAAKAGKKLHRRRQKTSWQFEQLENRLAFSVSPIETVSLSNDTSEGEAAIWTQELEWASREAFTATNHQYTSYSLPNDPNFPYQWHLLNTGDSDFPIGNPDFQDVLGVPGEDINVVPVWNMGITGEGVVVAVLDSGMYATNPNLIHPDLINNLHPSLRFNAIEGSNNPSPLLVEDGSYHGTAVAGLIAASWNNLGNPILDEFGNQVLDQNGNPVFEGGGTGVAPGATIVPIKMLGFGANGDEPLAALRYAWTEIDITNNSWGPGGFARVTTGLSPDELTTLRDTVRFGRGGLGTIHVFSSGNNGGPSFSEGFESFGNYDSAAYNGWTNSRYVITVGGVDHDGEYLNADGSFTSYPQAGPNVLVVAPTGSNAAQNVAEDSGQGSGIWTTDLLGDFGANIGPDENGFESDRDFWPDADYTSRFNGTSASAPLVSGVIALMLEANPNLTYRDVQEILVRSARQNAQFEQIPLSPDGIGDNFFQYNSWQTNQNGNFRNPDPFDPSDPAWNGIISAIFDPLANPNINDFLGPRQGHYESQPGMFTNSAGYTVSQGYGSYGELIGYGHGVIDAELAVLMAQQWHTLNQDLAPNTERTYTTFALQPQWNLPAAEQLPDDQTGLIIPGALGGAEGFSDYWSEYFADDPFVDYDGPSEFARGTYLEFEVPDTAAINLEWAEVKVDIEGPAEDLDFLRITLISPDGTHSELSNYYLDPNDFDSPFSIQPGTLSSGWQVDPAGDLDVNGGNFVWTFSTNRNWGERTSTATVIDPITREPLLDSDGLPIERGWELHIENWSNSEFSLQGLEIVWHGKPLEVGTQRVQGLIGIDVNNDGDFNYSRSIQTISTSDPSDLSLVRNADVVRQLDTTQEAFAANMIVEAFRVVNGVAESTPTAQFLTGADGNYYFDLVPADYVIRVTDPLDRTLLDDVDTDAQFLRHYKSEWTISEDWFFAQDHEAIDPLNINRVPEILYDAVMDAPMKFLDGFGQSVAAGIKNLNFLIKDEAPQTDVSGTVFADLNGNGVFDGNDTPHGGVTVYWDADQSGTYTAGELTTVTSDDPDSRGTYTLVLPATAPANFAIGVILPSGLWTATNPADAVQDVFASPGDSIGDITNDDISDGDVNFFLDPPNNAAPVGGSGPGDVFGVVFVDKDGDGFRDAADVGIPDLRVYIDVNGNNVFDGGDVEQITYSNGSFSFSDVPAGVVRIDVEHESFWQLTTPAAGFRQVTLGPGGGVEGVFFGLKNLATADWGDLPDSFATLDSSNGPRHGFLAGFHLGTKADVEVNGLPTPDADGDDAIGSDDDGVVITSNGGVLKPGLNTLQVTVAGVGGLLNGWIDFNGDGNFVDDPLEQVFDDTDLNPGIYTLSVTVPEGIADGTVGARFRWGEEGLSFTGPATLGEVEDYIFDSSNVQPLVLAGDYDLNGKVEHADRLIWMYTFGSTLDLRADGNNDGIVDVADCPIIVNNMGLTIGIGSGSGSGGSGSGVAGGGAALSGGNSTTDTDPPAALPSVEEEPEPAVLTPMAWPLETHFVQNVRATSSQPSSTTATADRRADLLDLALASLVTDSADDDAVSAERETFQDDEEEISELAFAVAWSDDNWWLN